MQKDLKIGILIGFFFAVAATLTISMWPTEHLEQRQKAAFENQSHTTSSLPPGSEPSAGSEKQIQENAVRWQFDDKHPAVMDDDLYSSALDTDSQNPPPRKKHRTHKVEKGDTLTSIARQYYDDPAKWTLIRDANTDTIKNPDSLSPGTTLIIPE